jgi:TRAP-type mannitol/chloroaromatic compound transport system permease small subunit
MIPAFGEHGQTMIDGLDRGIGGLIGAVKWLALAVAFLLFAQWPLREWVGAWSREANDLGQCLFALLVAASVTAATRGGRHIAADSLAGGYRRRTRRILAIIGILFGLLPWALFVAISASAPVGRSISGLERFQDTGNQGYFVVKMALLLLLGLMIAQSIIDLAHIRTDTSDDAGP